MPITQQHACAPRSPTRTHKKHSSFFHLQKLKRKKKPSQSAERDRIHRPEFKMHKPKSPVCLTVCSETNSCFFYIHINRVHLFPHSVMQSDTITTTLLLLFKCYQWVPFNNHQCQIEGLVPFSRVCIFRVFLFFVFFWQLPGAELGSIGAVEQQLPIEEKWKITWPSRSHFMKHVRIPCEQCAGAAWQAWRNQFYDCREGHNPRQVVANHQR